MQKSILNRTLISITLCIPLIIFISLLSIGTLDYKSHILPYLPTHLTNTTWINPTPCPQSKPLKVYMYDLPPKFNAALMDPTFPTNVTVNSSNLPIWRWSGGLRRQHSVEYWMMASVIDGGSVGEDLEAVRVYEAELADVFFVPFFSSLSFNVHVHNMADVDTVDQRLQREMIDILKASEYWKKSGGRDHVIPLHHPNAFRHYRDEISAAIFIVADFGRIMNISRLSKDVVAPYPHMLDTYVDDDHEDPYGSRKTLLFFRGRTKRKDEGKIRAQLHEMLDKADDIIYVEGSASEEGFKASTEQMRSSKFCLHPAGDTPSSCRLFDAIVNHCVPVIVSDRIELPFESEIDYKEFSIFFSVNEALKPGYMVSELRKLPKEKWVQMWTHLKNVSRHFEFQNPPIKDDAVNMIWRQVRDKVPEVKLAVHRSRRLKIPDWWR